MTCCHDVLSNIPQFLSPKGYMCLTYITNKWLTTYLYHRRMHIAGQLGGREGEGRIADCGSRGR